MPSWHPIPLWPRLRYPVSKSVDPSGSQAYDWYIPRCNSCPVLPSEIAISCTAGYCSPVVMSSVVRYHLPPRRLLPVTSRGYVSVLVHTHSHMRTHTSDLAQSCICSSSYALPYTHINASKARGTRSVTPSSTSVLRNLYGQNPLPMP